MTATIDDIKNWFDEGVGRGATHLFVIHDAFDHENYPVYRMPNQALKDVKNKYTGMNMQIIEEVYFLGKPFDEQKTKGKGSAKRVLDYGDD